MGPQGSAGAGFCAYAPALQTHAGAMKNTFALAVLMLGLMPQFAFASFDTNLKYGSRGDKVVELQEFLIDQGDLQGPATGNFYLLTLHAIKKFQAAQGIASVSGFWGPLTRAAARVILDQNLKQSNLEASTTPAVTSSPLQTTAPVQQTTPQVTTAPAPASAQQSVPATTPAQISTAIQPTSQARIQLININPDGLGTGSWSIDPTKGPFTANVATGQYGGTSECSIYPAVSQSVKTCFTVPNVFTVASSSMPSYDAAPDGYFTVFGAVVYNSSGYVDKAATVNITATDASQNKTITGTGTCSSDNVCYYTYGYLFTTPGLNTITFSADGVNQVVTVLVSK